MKNNTNMQNKLAAYPQAQQRFCQSGARQLGVTLVELLIAMGLSVFLMAAVVQSFLGTKQSSEIVQAQARMQENARFAYMFMNRSIRMAGYPSELLEPNTMPDVSIADQGWREEKMPASADYAEFSAQAVVWGEEDGASIVSGAKGDSDVMHIRLQGMGDGSVVECQGRTVPENAWAQLSFYVDADDNFRCRSDDGSGGAGAVQDEVLVEGIENMQIMYGLHAGVIVPVLDEYDASQVVRYVNSSEVTLEQWAMVSTIKVALLSASETQPLSSAGPDRSYNLLDSDPLSFADGKARQQFAQTIRVRNQNWSMK